MRQVIADRRSPPASFGDRDAKLLSFAILGAVNWIPRWFKPDGPASSQQIADCFADYLIGGLAATDGMRSSTTSTDPTVRAAADPCGPVTPTRPDVTIDQIDGHESSR